jgi:predicted regulator of Ras-like GTPase activity (Roadblock/LC7/MglB family)
MIGNTDVQDLLNRHVAEIAGVDSVVALSKDGLPTYWAGLSGADAKELQEKAEKTAALSSGLGSLARNVAEHNGAGDARRAVIELDDDRHVIVTRCGLRSFLTVTTSPGSDLGTVGYELVQLARRLGAVLDAERRSNTMGPAEGGAPA